jgi:hypothetical protein
LESIRVRGLPIALTAYMPKDLERYMRHPNSVPFSPALEAGPYVFAQDIDGKVWATPDRRHPHPKILGRARPVVAAGELTVGEVGEILDINNLSGTFQCHPDCLLTAIGGLLMQGAKIDDRAVTQYET